MLERDLARCSLPRMAFYSYLRMLRTHIGMEAMQGWGTVSSWRLGANSALHMPITWHSYTCPGIGLGTDAHWVWLAAERISDPALPIKYTDGSLKSHSRAHRHTHTHTHTLAGHLLPSDAKTAVHLHQHYQVHTHTHTQSQAQMLMNLTEWG